jgi:hypothetical protein
MAVYLFRREASGYIKIGASQNPEWRRREMHRLKDPIYAVATYESLDSYGDERRLHLMFSEKRVEGEWFALDDSDLDKIASFFQIPRNDASAPPQREVFDQVCTRCYYEWKSRRKTPAACPSCKSYRWNEPRDETPKEAAKRIDGQMSPEQEPNQHWEPVEE